ncbi:MAG: helix-turn-helix transcriptional regulator [Coriobacteriales bacterium]|jgi:DNA-binding CsgD family transcriptional regulator
METHGNATSGLLVPPAYVGVVFLLCWTYLLFYASTAGIEAAAPISLMSIGYTVSALCMTAVLLIIGFFPSAPQRKVEFLSDPAVKIITGLGLTAGTALLLYASFNQPLLPLLIAAIATGVFSGIMLQQWVMAYRNISLSSAICSFPILMAIIIGIAVTVLYFPPSVMYVVTCLLPLFSEFSFHRVRKNVMPVYDVETGPKDKPLNFVILLLPVFFYALASGFLDFFSSDSIYTFVYYALIAFIPLAIAAIFIYINARQDFLRALVVPFCFLFVTFVPFFTQTNIAPIAQFISIGELGVEVVLFIVIVGFADYFDLDALKTYALARLVIVAMNSCGWYIAQATTLRFDGLYNSQFSLLAVMIALEIAVIGLTVALVKVQKKDPEDLTAEERAARAKILSENEQGSIQRSNSASQAVDASSSDKEKQEAMGTGPLTHNERFDACCRSIAAKYSLSRREIDVLELLARGYTSAKIQSILYIAPGTVNYHTKNIYAKLGVHSKQEVISLVESRLSESS